MNRLWVRISLTFVSIITILVCLPITLGIVRQAFNEDKSIDPPGIQSESDDNSGLPFIDPRPDRPVG